MSFRSFLPLAIAAAMGLSATAAFADNNNSKHGRVIIIDQHGSDRHDRRHDRREDRWEDRRDRRHERAESRHERREDRRHDRYDRREDRWSYRDERQHPGVRYYYSARGPEFVRGHHLPRDLRVPQYVIVNPGHHHLRPPPRGHHWVQVGSDYVLVAIATGIIANIILNH
jgi:Ni/Co efflux regulator RcnB